MATTAAELVRRRWRILVAAAAGLATGFGLKALAAPPGFSSLIGWDAAAAVYLALTGPTLLFDSEADLRHRARREDENRAVIMSVILGCVAFSFAAIINALREAKDPHVHESHAILVALSVATLVLSWLVVQSLFTLHYAHRYFGDHDDDGEIDGGVQFQGDEPKTYRDFIYVAVCVGCCFQVSDFSLTGRRFRNLVTVHALISFAFNTLVLALGINIVSNLLGQ